MPKYCQQPKRTAQTIFDPGPGPRFVEEGRVKVTEMIKVFLFCFDIFHQGISLAKGKFGKYVNIHIDVFCYLDLSRILKGNSKQSDWWTTSRVQCWPHSSDCRMRKD